MDDSTKGTLAVLLGAGALWYFSRPSEAQAQPQPVGNGASTPPLSRSVASTLVTMAESFHLRPRATAESIGPEQPAQTVVQALERTTITRTIGRNTEVLFRVRLTDGSNTEGYAFFPPAQAARFPNVGPVPDPSRTTQTQQQTKAGEYYPAKALQGLDEERLY